MRSPEPPSTTVASVEAHIRSFIYPGDSAPALRDVHVSVPSGRRVVVRGDTGSGKSTLLGIVAGIVPSGSGGVLRGDVRVYGLRPSLVGARGMSRVLSYLPQDADGFAVSSTVDFELASGVEFSGLAAGDVRLAVSSTADALGITHLLGRRVASLSGGERQLVAIATALVRPVRLYVLDEPLAQLDEDSIALVLGCVRARVRELGSSAMMAEQLELPGLSEYEVVPLVGTPDVAHGAVRADERPLVRSSVAGEVRVRVDGIRLERRGVRVLSDVSVELRSGEVVAIVGPNGSGKTSLMRVLAGLSRPSAGSAWAAASFGGSSSRSRRLRMAFLPQNVGPLFCRESVREELVFCLGAVTDECREIARAGPLVLDDVLDRHPLDLSAGQRQWLALVQLLASAPDVLMLDEPTRGLHGSHRDVLGRRLREMARVGACVAFATHDRAFAARFADRVVVLDRGRLAGLGTPVDTLA